MVDPTLGNEAVWGDQELNALLDELPAMVGFWDADQVTCFVNRAYAEWFGRPAQELVGTQLADLLGEQLYTQNLRYLGRALRGEKQDFERQVVDAAGQERRTYVAYTPHLVDGAVEGVLVLEVDVSSRVEAEAALLRSSQEVVLLHERERIARKLGAVVDRVLAGASADLAAALEPGAVDLPGKVRSASEQIDAAVLQLRRAIYALGHTSS